MSSTYFDDQWLQMPECKSWLIRGDNNATAKCCVCPIPRNKTELSNMGKQALKSHKKKHCERLALCSQTSRISFTPISKSQPPPSPAIQTPDTSKISTLDSYIMSDSVTDAEIRWTLKNVLSCFSFRSCDDLSGLFKAMFLDSAIAEKFSLQKDKCAYYLNYGIAPHFRSILVDEVEKSEYYAASFDESQNSVIQMGQMDLVVNYWDDVLNQVCTRYLNSTFVGHSRSNIS